MPRARNTTNFKIEPLLMEDVNFYVYGPTKHLSAGDEFQVLLDILASKDASSYEEMPDIYDGMRLTSVIKNISIPRGTILRNELQSDMVPKPYVCTDSIQEMEYTGSSINFTFYCVVKENNDFPLQIKISYEDKELILNTNVKMEKV